MAGVVVLDGDAVMKELLDIKAQINTLLLSQQQRPEAISAGARWQTATAFQRENGIGRRKFARMVEAGAVASKDIGGAGKVYRWAE